MDTMDTMNSDYEHDIDTLEYIDRIDPAMWKEHLLHQIKLRDIMEKDRDAFEKMYNDLCIKYNNQSKLLEHYERSK